VILALAGGVGGARLALALAEALPPEDLVVAVNTGDDFEHLGLHVSPDLDTVMYTLAGINDAAQGWGIRGETWAFMEAIGRLGGDTWFKLGDRDMATHVERTRRLRAGRSLSDVTEALCRALSIRHRVVPMSDDPVPTVVHTADGALAFQDYFVRRRAEPIVRRIEYRGAERASMSPGLRVALDSAALEAIVVCPSNPYLSVGPLLAVPGVRAALERRCVPAIAVSPIVGGQAIKGPAAKIMGELGEVPSCAAIARWYRGIVDVLAIDASDAAEAPAVRDVGVQPLVTPTVMRDATSRAALAAALLRAVREGAPRRAGGGIA
jgi:LPPG:FO 2-phospho-L-lactate transferase